MGLIQQSLFEEKTYYGKSATHTGGKGEVFHDWYPYLEGFSSSFVSSVFEKYLPKAKKILEKVKEKEKLVSEQAPPKKVKKTKTKTVVSPDKKNKSALFF